MFRVQLSRPEIPIVNKLSVNANAANIRSKLQKIINYRVKRNKRLIKLKK